MPKKAALPLPNDPLHGGIVIASVWVGDDDANALVVVLMPQSPYYRVMDLIWFDAEWWNIEISHQFLNIVPAVDEYQERGGDY